MAKFLDVHPTGGVNEDMLKKMQNELHEFGVTTEWRENGNAGAKALKKENNKFLKESKKEIVASTKYLCCYLPSLDLLQPR